MVDRLRAYRRWRHRRLFLLAPVFAAALATQLWLAAGSGAPAWVRVVSLGTSGLILALIGYLLAQTLLCSRLHDRGNRAAARALRDQLAPSGRAALGAAVLLAVLNSIPYLIPHAPEKPPPLPPGRRVHYLRGAESAGTGQAVGAAPEPAPTTAAADAPALAAAPSAPDIRPFLEGLPLRLTVEDAGPAPEAPIDAAFLDPRPQEPPRTSGEEGGEDVLRHRPGVQDGFQLTLDDHGTLTFSRLGVPQDGHAEDWLPPELRLDVSILKGRERGTEFSLLVDVPISPRESIRTSIAVAGLQGDEFLEESGAESWTRVTIAYSQRLAGYTRSAPFDLTISIGVAADRYRIGGPDGPMDERTRLSPYLSVDAAVWQHGSAGLLLHAGYSIPLNVTGASSGVLDLSATVRIDLTESISIHAGYRYLALRLRDYDDAFLGSVSNSAFSDHFSGPIIGLDVRF
jgi:hypothetical protein